MGMVERSCESFTWGTGGLDVNVTNATILVEQVLNLAGGDVLGKVAAIDTRHDGWIAMNDVMCHYNLLYFTIIYLLPPT